MFFFSYFFIFIEVLISIAFLALYERVLLGAGNFRKGPNYLFFVGFFQSFSDLIKLFYKNIFMFYFSEGIFFFFFPLWGFVVLFFFYIYLPYEGLGFFFSFGFFYLLLFYSLMMFKFIFLGWVSYNFYGFVSSYRSLVQMISYEVGLFFMFIFLSMFYFSMDFFFYFFWDFKLFLFFSPVFFFFFIYVLVVELGRSPFDFIEGESELVSGFNIEYGGYLFSLIFLIEYGMLLFTSYFISFLFFNFYFFMFFIYFLIFIRLVFVRYRYDFMILVFWKDYIYLLFIWMIFIFCFF